jgi:DDE superfamily endonuclease
MTGLPSEQVLELVDRVEDYLGGWHPERGRRREMELFDAVIATLFYYRHNCSQEVTGVVFGVSQSTISRMVNALEEPIAAVLDCEVPELVEVITGRVIIPDGTLIPTGNRAAHRELYSASATGAARRSRFCRAPTVSCATLVNRSPDPATT